MTDLIRLTTFLVLMATISRAQDLEIIDQVELMDYKNEELKNLRVHNGAFSLGSALASVGLGSMAYYLYKASDQSLQLSHTPRENLNYYEKIVLTEEAKRLKISNERYQAWADGFIKYKRIADADFNKNMSIVHGIGAVSTLASAIFYGGSVMASYIDISDRVTPTHKNKIEAHTENNRSIEN